MPDTNLSSRADYSIRLANTNVWENGYNNLNYSFVKESLGISQIVLPNFINFDKVYVYNMLGQLVSEDSKDDFLPNGVYMIIGIKDDITYSFKKIIKN